jgi:hypothetical protein
MKKKPTNLKKLIKKADSLWSKCVRTRARQKYLKEIYEITKGKVKPGDFLSIEDFKG